MVFTLCYTVSMKTLHTTKFKTSSIAFAYELYIEFVENGLDGYPDLSSFPDAWISLARKVKATRGSEFDLTPDEAKELAKALYNMIDIQYDHMDDAEGRAVMRAMQSMYKKARAI